MNKADLIADVAARTGLSRKDSEKAVNAALDSITAVLQEGSKVQLVGFGVFDVKERGVRMGRNPKTREEIEIPATRVPQFKPGKALKEAVAGESDENIPGTLLLGTFYMSPQREEHRMEEKKKGGRAALYLLLFALAVGADQLLKRYIVVHIPLDPAPADQLPLLPGVVHLTHIHNYGAAFSMLQGRRWFFLGLLGLFCVLVVVAIRKQWLEDEFSRVLAVLAAGGAVGNGIDRAALGYVVDMFEVEFMHFAVFNLADAILCVCAALYTVKTLWEMAEEKRGKV